MIFDNLECRLLQENVCTGSQSPQILSHSQSFFCLAWLRAFVIFKDNSKVNATRDRLVIKRNRTKPVFTAKHMKKNKRKSPEVPPLWSTCNTKPLLNYIHWHRITWEVKNKSKSDIITNFRKPLSHSPGQAATGDPAGAGLGQDGLQASHPASATLWLFLSPFLTFVLCLWIFEEAFSVHSKLEVLGFL